MSVYVCITTGCQSQSQKRIAFSPRASLPRFTFSVMFSITLGLHNDQQPRMIYVQISASRMSPITRERFLSIIRCRVVAFFHIAYRFSLPSGVLIFVLFCFFNLSFHRVKCMYVQRPGSRYRPTGWYVCTHGGLSASGRRVFMVDLSSF